MDTPLNVMVDILFNTAGHVVTVVGTASSTGAATTAKASSSLAATATAA